MLRTRPGWAATLVTGFAVLASGSLAIAQDDQSDQDQSDRQQQREDDERESADREDRERENREGENRERDEQGQNAEESRDAGQRDEQSRQEQARQEQARQEQDRQQRARDQQDERAQQGQAGQRQEQQGVMLGVAVEESPTTGVLIRDVLPGSAAEQAGLRSGDYILAVDDQRIGSPQQFDELLTQMQPGRSELTIWRNEQRQQIPVNLTTRQQAQFRAQPQPGQQFQQGGQAYPQGQDDRPDGQRQDRQSQAWLGVLLSEQQEERGVRVAQVYPSGPAARAGLRSGDIVLQIDDSEVSSAQELARIVERQEPDSQIELVIVRGENEEPVEVTLGNRSDYFGDAQFQQNGQFQQQGGQFQQGGQSGDFDHFSVPEHAMMLEQHRHLASQHQRIERLLYELRQEVQSLRQEIQALSGQQGQPRGARAVPGLPQPPNDDSADLGRPAQRRTLRPGFEGGAQPGTAQPVPGSAQPVPGTTQPVPRSDNRAQPNATAP